jgi:hypothetical protein
MEDIELTYLLFDGQKDARAVQNQINCDGTNNYNYRTSNLMLPGYMYDRGRGEVRERSRGVEIDGSRGRRGERKWEKGREL